MTRVTAYLPWGILTVLAAGVAVIPSTRAAEVGYVEDFALARDRAAALARLVPGTEDYYYYHALHALNTEQYEKATELTRPWLERFGQTARLTEIQTRHALLSYEKNPKRSLEYLRGRLGLTYQHRREVPGAVPDLPTTLDHKRIARDTLRADSLARWQNLDNFEDTALDHLPTANLTWERRRNLLARLTRPDRPDLPQLVADDLNAPHPQQFGAYPIHARMTRSQLDTLLKLKPDLLNQTAFVNTWLSKLQPGADADWRHDHGLARAYLGRLEEFVTRLSPAHNSLKAHVLYHRLVLDRADGIYDKARFLAYLQLPRHQPYMARALQEAAASRSQPADLNADFAPITRLPRIGADEALVRSYLSHLLLDAASPKEFEPYIDDVYLQHLFAETKVVNGLGDPEAWASRLPPDVFAALRDRVDIDFAPTHKTDYAADEPVKLSLFVKNVPSLVVKVFEINTHGYYRTLLKEIDTNINLDGLVPNAEQTHTYGDPPLRRIARTFEFPNLSKPGVYVIDFVGAGRGSRALIRKGRLMPIVGTGTAGQTVTVVNDVGQPVPEAGVWLGGREYRADKDGVAVVPFSAEPGRRPIVLSRGDFACLDHIDHQAETYHLAAGFHVDRESLLTQRVAPVMVRPGLMLNGRPVSVKLLTNVRLRLTSADHTGIATSTEVPDFTLYEDREAIHEFRVPARLASLHVSLKATVASLSQGKPVELSAESKFILNGIDRTDKVEDLHLARFGADYVVELLGRTGEARPNRAVQFVFKHRDFKEPVRVSLKSDARGRILLGPLSDITTVTATGPEGTAHTWPLTPDQHTYRAITHAKVGDPITLPYLGTGGKPTREELALFEVHGDQILTDRFDALAIADGRLELRGLGAGDYDLWMKRTGVRVRVRITDGPVVHGHVLGRMRHLQLPGLKPVQIAAVTADDAAVTVRLTDASPFTRVHVFATRYEPAISAFANLGQVRDAALTGIVPTHPMSSYLTGRNIGDEYRYVLERRAAKKFPGNMLERPSLLLSPWVVRTTDAGEQLARGGEDFAPRGTPAPSAAMPGASSSISGSGKASSGEFADLDFLADATAVILNRVPDKNGVVVIDRAKLGPHAIVRVAAVDPLNVTVRTVTLPEKPAAFVDLRLLNGLDPASHFTQQKRISALTPKQPFVVSDIATSRFEAYDSLARVFTLYSTLSHDPRLAEFAFLPTWPTLQPDRKRELYSKYASHELNFFLSKKDPEFFTTVVKPYLANKKDKTFIDHYLLGGDLTPYLDPWRHGRLNTVERVLLAQRVVGEPAKTARYLDDLLRLVSPNTDRGHMLFDTAVQSGALTQNDALGLGMLRSELQQNRPVLTPPSAPPGLGGVGAGVPPGAAGGMGGMPPPPAPGRPTSPTALDPSDKGKADAKSEKGTSDESKTRDGRNAGKKFQEKRRAIEPELAEREELQYFLEERELHKARVLYRRIDPTMEWAENNYYHAPIQHQVAALVPVGPFWLDYARHDGKTPFLSTHVADASRNFTEMVFALAVLDLPFTAGKHEIAFERGAMTLTPAGPAIAFHEEVRPAAAPDDRVPVLVGQNFYRHADRYREEGGEKIDKFITGEFLTRTVYGGEVVVTNPTSSRQRLSVLIQVPVGAIPVGDSRATRTVPLDLEPYRTQAVNYLFYFPRPGKFAQFPAHVARAEKVVAAAKPTTFTAVDTLSKPDTTSWEYVSQNGTTDEVVAFLTRENVHALNLDRIAFRMADRAVFDRVLAVLRERHQYAPTLWSYALLHDVGPAAREYLAHVDQIVTEAGGPIESPLLTIDPIARHQYEHLEYRPLVNARAHSLGERRQIVNGPLHEQYHRLLKTLSYRRTLGDVDLLAVTYYLLVQDRIAEAQAAFAQVNPDRVPTRVQYDYCAAYLHLFADDPTPARAIALKYAEYPVDRWRTLFAAIRNHVDEATGAPAQLVRNGDPESEQGQLAATEPGFEVAADRTGVTLTWQNLHAVTLHYHLMDAELLFSRSPFAQQRGDSFALTRPTATQTVQLPAGQAKLVVPLPNELARRNVLVEVSAGGTTRAVPYFAAAMDVQFTEAYGRVRVTDAAGGRPLPRVYVKVYARLANGEVKFHKDGYTDHRGRFDYATVSTSERLAIERFAVLVLSEAHGATIREAVPPQQ